MTIHLGRRSPDGSCGLPGGQQDGPSSPCLALLPVGLAEPPGSPRALVRSYRTVSPLPVRRARRPAAIGGLLSVALSCGSPRLGVTQHRALWSPDVPRTGPVSRRPGPRPPGRLATARQSKRSRSGTHTCQIATFWRRRGPARRSARRGSRRACRARRRSRGDRRAGPGRSAGLWPLKSPRCSSRTSQIDDADRDPEHERADAGERAVGEARVGHRGARPANPPSA